MIEELEPKSCLDFRARFGSLTLENDVTPSFRKITKFMSELVNDKTKSYHSDFIAGVFGGVLAGHPFDTVKVRLQAEKSIYKGGWHTFTSIVREEKIRGLYKGLASPFVGVAVINSLLFGVYGWTLDRVTVDGKITTSGVFLAGAFSGLINAFLSCPIELLKIRLQNQAKEKLYNGNIDLIKKIWAKNGWKGFYRGLGITIIRETPSYGVYFASYELMTKSMGGDSSMALLVAGGLAGVLGWTITYPADCLKTRIQSVQNEQNRNYDGVFRPFRTIYQAEGPRPFFRGIGATAVRAFPTNACTFFTVVFVKNYLDGVI